jgi:hypothetical protein
MRLGIARHFLPVPGLLWRRGVTREARGVVRRLAFMTDEHRRVRDFIVTEIVRTAAAVSPAAISERLGIAQERVIGILDELEAKNVFLVRGSSGEVEWAYPVTAAETPHRIRYRSGEARRCTRLEASTRSRRPSCKGS